MQSNFVNDGIRRNKYYKEKEELSSLGLENRNKLRSMNTIDEKKKEEDEDKADTMHIECNEKTKEEQEHKETK